MSRAEARRPARHRALTVWMLFFGFACGGSPEPTEPIAVVGATLIDGTLRGPVQGAVILMRDGRFECVGDRETCPIPSDARVIDGSGHWVSPAFIDTHVHLWWLQDSVWTARAQVLRLAAGITTVREMGSAHQLPAVLAAAREAATGSHPGPRIYASGRVASQPGGDEGTRVYGRLVEEFIERGVDGLKIKTGLPWDGLVSALAEAESRGYDVYGHATEAATDEAELEDAFRLGLDGVVHVLPLAVLLQSPSGATQRQEGGLAWIELWQNIDAELEERLIAAMVAEDVWLEPTLVGTYLQVNPQAHAGAPGLRFLPTERAASLRRDTLPSGYEDAASESLKRMGDLVSRFKARGGLVVVGTDQLEVPAFAFHEEIVLLVEAGLTPHEALRAATSEAAVVLGWDDRLGTVETGRIADMVLLSADPMADIRNTREIRLVFKGGVPHDPVELEAGLAGDSP